MAKKGFQFRFQSILDVKEHQEKALEIELARIDRAILAQKETGRQWERTRRQVLDELGKAQRNGDMVQSIQCGDYLRHVRRRIGDCHAVVAELDGEREQARAELERVMRSRKALENYRDKLRGEFIAEQEKAEEKILELHSASRFIRAEGAR